jgi:hypothetical protein
MNKMFQKYIFKTYLVAVFTFCCMQSTFGQNKIVLEVQKLQQDNVQFVPVSPLTVDASIDTEEVNKAVSNATLAKADDNKLNQIASGQWPFLELEIPYQNQNFKLQLYRVNPFSDNFSIDTDRNKNIQYQKGVYYRGMIKGNSQSVASFNFFNGTFNGVFSSQELGNIVVGKMDKPNNQNDYVIYSDANFLQANEFECHVKEQELAPAPPETNQSVNTLKCVNLYFEIDYNLFQSTNSSTTQTANWMTSVFNNVQTLFANDGVTVALNALYIWTNPDVFQNIGTSSADYLYGFADYRPTINGDVGMLVGIDPGGLGGVAFLNSICQNFNYAYSDLNGISVSTVPTYSWTTQVITHEFGHSFGSPHTHACFWNGNNTPIDGCGSQAGAAENGCTVVGPIPSTTVKGTIMSYCHLIQGVGISFTNGFGIQPATLMTNTVNAKPCLSTDCISSCYNTATNVQVANITNNSANVTWNDLDEDITSWQISVRPFAATSVWNTVSTANYAVSGLLPNSYYQVKIRPTCTTTNASILEYVFATSGSYCNSLPFYDTGGVQNNYSNRESFTRTITPNLPHTKIVVTFTQFALEEDYDFLYIYDGPDDSYLELNGGVGFSGTDSPGVVASTAIDGSLTFKFTSDQIITGLGWAATFTCQETLNVNSEDFIDFSYYPNPTKDNITLKSNTSITEIEVFNIQGRKLFSEKLETLDTTVDLSQFAPGTYFFKVRFDTNVIKNFKVLKM